MTQSEATLSGASLIPVSNLLGCAICRRILLATNGRPCLVEAARRWSVKGRVTSSEHALQKKKGAWARGSATPKRPASRSQESGARGEVAEPEVGPSRQT